MSADVAGCQIVAKADRLVESVPHPLVEEEKSDAVAVVVVAAVHEYEEVVVETVARRDSRALLRRLAKFCVSKE